MKFFALIGVALARECCLFTGSTSWTRRTYRWGTKSCRWRIFRMCWRDENLDVAPLYETETKGIDWSKRYYITGVLGKAWCVRALRSRFILSLTFKNDQVYGQRIYRFCFCIIDFDQTKDFSECFKYFMNAMYECTKIQAEHPFCVPSSPTYNPIMCAVKINQCCVEELAGIGSCMD